MFWFCKQKTIPASFEYLFFNFSYLIKILPQTELIPNRLYNSPIKDPWIVSCIFQVFLSDLSHSKAKNVFTIVKLFVQNTNTLKQEHSKFKLGHFKGRYIIFPQQCSPKRHFSNAIVSHYSAHLTSVAVLQENPGALGRANGA